MFARLAKCCAIKNKKKRTDVKDIQQKKQTVYPANTKNNVMDTRKIHE